MGCLGRPCSCLWTDLVMLGITTAVSSQKLLVDNLLLAPLFTKIEAKHGKRKSRYLILFARRLFASSSPAELAKLPPGQLYKEVLAAWRFMRVRKRLTPMIQFTHNTEGLINGTVIHILLDDMPFLVDSISHELTHRSISIDAVYNAVCYLQRDGIKSPKIGKLTSLLAEKQIGSHGEALLCFHVGRLSNEECDALQTACLSVLHHVKSAVQDFAAMCAKALAVKQTLQTSDVPVSKDELEESCEFIDWLVDHHFTFLGYEQYRIVDSKQGKKLNLQKNSLLGISKLKLGLKTSVLLESIPGGAGELILTPQLCSFAKSPQRSKVHRPGYCDYVLIKEFDSAGDVRIEHRFLGLYTSAVYFQSASEIPLLRKKVSQVLARSGFSANGHSIKGLFQVINVFPREELFQISAEQLFSTAMQITHIHERRKVRLFVRRDSYGKLFSCLVYVPRDFLQHQGKNGYAAFSNAGIARC